MTKSKSLGSPANLSTVVISTAFSAQAGIGSPIITTGYSSKGRRYIPYSGNAKRYNVQNTYPQILAELVINSPTHGAAIATKSMLTKGKGFDLSNVSRNLKKMLSNVNVKQQTVDDVLELVAADFATYNGLAIKVQWSKAGKIVAFERVPFSQVRVGEPTQETGNIDYYVISNDWAQTMPTRLVREYAIRAFNPNALERLRNLPLTEEVELTDEEAANGVQLIYYFADTINAASNGMEFYPVPDYAGGLDNILTEIDIHISNKSLINNGVGGKTVINVPLIAASEEAAQDYRRKFINNFTNAANNGGVVVNFSEDKESLPQISNIEALDADTYKGLHEINIQAILTAHRIPAILLNIRNGSGWNNAAEEMEAAFNIMNKTVIASYQTKLERIFNTIVGFMGYEVSLQILPFTLISSGVEDKTVETVGDKTSLDGN